jgi:hypothetical protein
MFKWIDGKKDAAETNLGKKDGKMDGKSDTKLSTVERWLYISHKCLKVRALAS